MYKNESREYEQKQNLEGEIEDMRRMDMKCKMT